MHHNIIQNCYERNIKKQVAEFMSFYFISKNLIVAEWMSFCSTATISFGVLLTTSFNQQPLIAL